MKYIYILIFISFCCSVKAQVPTGFPSQRWAGWIEPTYVVPDSGTIITKRDTLWTPRFPGTMVTWFHSGVDTANWFWTGLNWKRVSAAQLDTTSLSNRINLKLNLSDTSSMLSPYLRKIDTTNHWVQNVYARNDSLFKLKNGTETFVHTFPTSGSGTVTSISVSVPAAMSVTPSTITTSGTFNFSGAGLASQYVKGDFTLGTTDTSMIPNFFSKVRSEFSGTSPITYNSTTGAISINNANTTGTKGAASFTSSFSDNGSGQIDLATLVSAGSCTGCVLNVDAKGRIVSYADGPAGATNNTNIGSGFRPVNELTQQMRTYFGGFGSRLDTVTNTNGITWRADTTRVTGLPTYYYVDSSVAAGGGTNVNIGSGYRWAVPFTHNIKTANPGYGIFMDSSTLSNTITVKVDTNTVDSRYPKVYNVALYGAVPDGKERYDGAMTSGSPTLSCVSCVFTSGDIGKSIRVEGAITNGDLVTTITGFTNSSTVTLGANATRTVSGDTLAYGTDNTAFIQAAINDAFNYGNGIVYIPGSVGFGFYVLAGPLVTSYLGTNPNAQLIWPIADLGQVSFNTRKHVLIQGCNPAYNTPSAWGSDTLTAKYGTTLYSIIDGSGTLPSVFGTKGITSGYGFFNYNEISFKNLAILVARNKYNGGPSVGGINGLYSSTTNVDDVLIGINGSIFKQPQPTHDVAALVVGKKDSEIYSHIRNTSVFCFKYGFIWAEDVVVDKAVAHACIYGHTFTDGNYPIVASSLDAHWCKYSVYVPNYNLFGLIPLSSNVSNFHVNYLSCEVFTGSFMGSPSWLNYSKIVLDSGSRGRGTIDAYNIGEAGVGLNNSLFNKFGSDSIYAYQVGSRVDPNPHSYTNRLTWNYINKIGASQNNGAEGYFYNWSPLSDATIIRAQPTVTNGSQGLYLSPSGTGGSSVTPLQSWINLFNIAQWTGENTVNSSSEALTIAAAGTRYYLGTSASGGGTVRPLSLETGSNTDQVNLATDGAVTINGNANTELSILGTNSNRISMYIKNSNASGNSSFYCDNSRGSFAAYGGMLTGGASDATGNIFGMSRADKTFIFHDGASGLGMGVGTLINQPLVLGTNNTERLKIAGSGAITFNSAYTFPTSDGTASQVLQTNGSGVVSWATPTSATTLYTGDGTANNRTVTVTGSTLTFTSTLTGANSTVTVNNTSSGHGLIGNASGAGYGLYGIGFRGVYGNGSGGGTGVYGQETSGIGLRGVVTTGTGLEIDHTPTSFNDIQTAQLITRLTSGNSGNGANGIGTAIQFAAPTTTTTSASVGGALNWSWSTATNASRTGKFALQLVNNAGSLSDKFIINGNGSLQAPNYGVGTFSGTPAYTPQFDASGNILEKPIPYSLYYSDTSATTVTNTTTETSVVGNVIGSTSFNGDLLIPGSVIRLKGYGYLSTDATPGNLTMNFIVSNFTLGITISTLLPAGITNSDIDYEFEVTPFGLGINQDMFYIGKIDIVNNTTGALVTQRFQGKGQITTTGTLSTDVTAKWSSASTNNILNDRNNVLEIRRIQ